jgi:hypothetical protein
MNKPNKRKDQRIEPNKYRAENSQTRVGRQVPSLKGQMPLSFMNDEREA